MGDRYERVSDIFQILSHSVRLQILDELRWGEACVCHLQGVLGRPQPYISQQLSKLREANLVTDRREGLYVYYSLSDDRIERLLEVLLGPPQDRSSMEACPCPRCEKTSIAGRERGMSAVSSRVGERV